MEVASNGQYDNDDDIDENDDDDDDADADDDGDDADDDGRRSRVCSTPSTTSTLQPSCLHFWPQAIVLLLPSFNLVVVVVIEFVVEDYHPEIYTR